MTVTLKDILERVEPEELIDILGLTVEDLAELLDVTLTDNLHKFDYLDRGDSWNE